MGKILVTGGTGFIGSHTCVALINAGYQVVIMDNLCNSKVEAIARIEMITGKHVRFYRTDMRDEEDMRQIFEDNKIDAVIHFAGLKAVGESVEKPLEYYENNISGTLSLLRVMREYHCNVIIFSSSATVYGCNNEAPYVEEMPTSATNPYGYTKVMIEQSGRLHCQSGVHGCGSAVFQPDRCSHQRSAGRESKRNPQQSGALCGTGGTGQVGSCAGIR